MRRNEITIVYIYNILEYLCDKYYLVPSHDLRSWTALTTLTTLSCEKNLVVIIDLSIIIDQFCQWYSFDSLF